MQTMQVMTRHYTVCHNTICTVSVIIISQLIVVVFVFNVPPTAKVIWRRGHSLKSHPTDW